MRERAAVERSAAAHSEDVECAGAAVRLGLTTTPGTPSGNVSAARVQLLLGVVPSPAIDQFVSLPSSVTANSSMWPTAGTAANPLFVLLRNDEPLNTCLAHCVPLKCQRNGRPWLASTANTSSLFSSHETAASAQG